MGTNDYIFLILGAVGFGVIGIAIMASPTESAIPPTPAFSTVYINGVPITAETFNDNLHITTEGIITTAITGKSITMRVQQPEMNCPLLQGVTGFDEDGVPICGVL